MKKNKLVMNALSVLGVIFLFSISIFLSGCEAALQGNLTNTSASAPEAPLVTGEATAGEGAAPVPPTMVTPPQEEVQTITINETQKIKISPQAIDPDGDYITYTFSAPLDANGEWQTKIGDAGEYDINVVASDGVSTINKKIHLVVKSLNRAPVLGKIFDINAKEGDTIKLEPVAVDPDGDAIIITYSGWMDSAEKTTAFGDAGEHYVTVTASDSQLSDEQKVKITVLHVNREPQLFPIVDTVATEGDLIQLKAAASDPDNDPITFTFEAPFDENGAWQTDIGDAGRYQVKVVASDGQATAEQTALVIVNAKNRAPELQVVPDQVVDEGQTLAFTIAATDADNDPLALSVENLPAEAIFNEATQEFSWAPGYDTATSQEGSKAFVIKFTVTDGKESASKEVKITVNNINRPPQWAGVEIV